MIHQQDILYEDNHLIAVNKKVSDIVQGDKTGDIPLDHAIRAFIKERDKKPGNVYLGIPHRIDRPVSGAMIYTKTSKALSRMNALFQSREVEKIYFAIVRNRPPAEHDILEDYLKKNEKQNKSYITGMNTKGARLAVTEYQVAAHSDNYFLVRIQIHTGRHHQIRSQLSNIGCPIKGDLKYGYPRSNKNGGISLHARSLGFVHPVRNEKIFIQAPFPEDDIWRVFGEEVWNSE